MNQVLSCKFVILSLIFLAAIPAFASKEDEDQVNYLFAGALQERAKLKSWSCTIKGRDPENGQFELKLLSNGESVRFTRKQFDTVVHACDNRKLTAYWDESQDLCNIEQSTSETRRGLYLWDPRAAGLVLGSLGRDYIKEYNERLGFWHSTATVTKNGDLRTITYVRPDKFQDTRLSITVDAEHGFTPILYRGESIYKENSKFPGKNELYYKASAKWEQFNGVWLPKNYTEESGSGQLIRDYDITWDWINREIHDNQFTIDALGLPEKVKKVYFEKGREVPMSAVVPSAERKNGRAKIRWVGYSIGLIFLIIAVMMRHLRRRNTKTV